MKTLRSLKARGAAPSGYASSSPCARCRRPDARTLDRVRHPERRAEASTLRRRRCLQPWRGSPRSWTRPPECAFGQVQEPGRKRRVGQMMPRRLLEARQRTPTRAPTSNWIKQPKLRLVMIPRCLSPDFCDTSSSRSPRPFADAQPEAVPVACPPQRLLASGICRSPCAQIGAMKGGTFPA